MWDFIYMCILNNFSLTCEFLSFYAPRTSSISSHLPLTFFHYQNVIHGPSVCHQREPCVNPTCSSMGISSYILAHWNCELFWHWQHSFVGHFSRIVCVSSFGLLCSLLGRDPKCLATFTTHHPEL